MFHAFFRRFSTPHVQLGLGISGKLIVGAAIYTLYQEKTTPLHQMVFKDIERTAPTSLPKDFQRTEWWKNFKKTGVFEQKGDDKTWRPIAVGLQAAIEASLLNLHQTGRATIRAHVTHADLPATPFCGVTLDDLSPTISADPARRATISTRTEILAKFLTEKIPMTVIYSEDGLEKRSAAAQTAYQANVARYPNLHDTPIQGRVAEKESGATITASKKGSTAPPLLFSICAPQSTTEGTEFNVYCNEKDNPKIAEMQEQRKTFFMQHHIRVPGLTEPEAHNKARPSSIVQESAGWPVFSTFR